MNISSSFVSAISFLTFLLFLPLALTSQVWDEVYNASEAHAIHYAGDGSFLLVGGTGDPSESYFDMSVKKIDREGNLIWEQTYVDPEGNSTLAREIVSLDNGEFLIIGNIYPSLTPGVRLWRIDKSGVLLETGNLDSYDLQGIIFGAMKTQDGNIILTLNRRPAPGMDIVFSLIKITPAGELLWLEDIAEDFHYPTDGLSETAEGLIYIVYFNGVAVFNSTGDRINTIPLVNRPYDIYVLPSGDILAVGNSSPFSNGTNYIARVTSSGEVLWEISTGPAIGGANLDFVEPLASGNFFALGHASLGYDPETGEESSGATAFEFTTEGELIWYEAFLGNVIGYFPTDIYTLDQESFVISILQDHYGDTQYVSAAAAQFTTGVSEKRFLWQVNAFEDINENCIDEEEIPLAAQLIKVEGNNEVHFMHTNAVGATEFNLLPATYTSDILIDEEVWLANDCLLPQTDTLHELNSLVEHHFPVHARINCPSLTANGIMNVLRPCFSNNSLTINICNNGSAAADTAIVEVYLPEGATTFVQNEFYPQGAWLNNFQIPWYDLGPGECASVNFSISLDCSVNFGATLCVTTRILSNQICDGSPIQQAFNQFCLVTTGSYDPNNKLAQPVGQGNERIIPPDTLLNYTINFQNTGTDTAFLVVIRDTLPPQLAGATLRPGSASHPYQLAIKEDSILTFTFPYILLPDSNVNVIGSQGYVRYDIEMQAGLPLGTTINNRAGIYFDFNDPILTEYAFHKLGIPTDVMEVKDEISAPFQLYPNPAQAQVSLIYQGKSAIATLRYQIITRDGRIIRSGSNPGTAPINIEALLPGMYFVLAWSEKGYLGAQTMVKQ